MSVPAAEALANAVSTFLHGPYGSGKTTLATQHLLNLLAQGTPGREILVLTPQRALQQPYRLAWLSSHYAGDEITFATLGGLARRMTELFWPLVSERFAHPAQPPVFLTQETAQYYMAYIVQPLIEKENYFKALAITRQRLYAQILDNLNKAALIGFPPDEIGARLAAAWIGNPTQKNAYAELQVCVDRFRAFCFQHNLLDFSLQTELFIEHLWPHPVVRQWLQTSYRHLIYDNMEEDPPRAHDLIAEWLPDFDSALLIFDEGGGHRQFLGADPHSAWQLGQRCQQTLALPKPMAASPSALALHNALDIIWRGTDAPLPEGWRAAMHALSARFYPQLLDEVAHYVAERIAEGMPPEDIVILSPYLSDALRFALQTRLEALGVPSRTHRPSRALRDEPAVRAMLTLAQIAHPQWEKPPLPADVAAAFLQVLQTDLVRARLLQEILWRSSRLQDFDKIKPDMQERLGYDLGARYNNLREWLLAYQAGDPLPLDHFLRLLFGEVLSQPGYGFHRNLDAARSAQNLIESAGKFRRAFAPALSAFAAEPYTPEDVLAREYLQVLDDGLIAAQYLTNWQHEAPGVLISPAFTFLMMNRSARLQIWLDPGANGWSERLAQPLTNPYVLNRRWPKDKQWTDAEEVQAGREILSRLVSGLLLRCSGQIVLAITELGETGFEERGALLQLIQKLLQRGQNHA